MAVRGLSVGLLLAIVLAGCAGPAPAAERDGPGEPVDVAPGITVAGDRGAVLGHVQSDAGLAIQKARVSLLGTPHFADSDESGRFLLVNVTPGLHELQVQAEGFRVHGESLHVDAAAVTYANVTLEPVEGLLPDQRPHVHNLWRGRTEVVLADYAYDLTQRPGFRGGQTIYPGPYHLPSVAVDPNTNADGIPLPVPEQEDGSPSIVYPGTGEIHVTFDWTVDEDTTKDRFALMYRGPNMPRTTTEPGGPGTTWTIAINQTQVDGGHQQWTRWQFWAVYTGTAYATTSWDPGLNLGELHVTIRIVKGTDPPLEAAHEDHWGDATSMLLRTASDFSYGGAPTSERETFEVSLDEGMIVPPGTKRLTMHLTWRFENAIVPLMGDEYQLMWRTAAQNPHTTTWEQHRTAAATEEGAGFKVYEIEVAPEDTDQYYYTSSDWTFSPFRPGQGNESYDLGAQNRDRVFTLEIVAFR